MPAKKNSAVYTFGTKKRKIMFTGVSRKFSFMNKSFKMVPVESTKALPPV